MSNAIERYNAATEESVEADNVDGDCIVGPAQPTNDICESDHDAGAELAALFGEGDPGASAERQSP